MSEPEKTSRATTDRPPLTPRQTFMNLSVRSAQVALLLGKLSLLCNDCNRELGQRPTAFEDAMIAVDGDALLANLDNMAAAQERLLAAGE